MHIQWAGLFFIGWGAFAFFTSVLHPDTFRWNFRSGIAEAFLGKTGARIFFTILGTGLCAFGSLVLVGVIAPSEERTDRRTRKPTTNDRVVATGQRSLIANHRFSIVFPPGWEIEESSDSHVAVFNREEGRAGGFQPNLQLGVVPRPAEPDFFEKNCAELPALMEGFKMLSRGTHDAGGLEQKWIAFQFREHGVRLRSLNYVAVVGDDVVTMAGVCGEDQCGSVFPVFKACAESLRVAGVGDTK